MIINIIINKFAGDKIMSEMHLRPTGFTYSSCGPFSKKAKTKNTKTQHNRGV